MGNINIYIMTHKKFNVPEIRGYIPLQVGHSISENLGYLCDDAGENISEKNKSYCEMTGIYWVWKHSSSDYVGVCHYRRYFYCNGHIINEQEINALLEDYDCIVGNSSSTSYESLWKHYAAVHVEKDIEICREVIKEKFPSYVDAFDTCMNCNLFTVGNMIITSKAIFDEYCSWVFDILDEIEKRIDIANYDTFQYRVFGYIAERLLRVWLINHTLKVCELEVKLIEN